MAVEHNIITDPEIHEPKGVSSAASTQLYIADGTGGGSWDRRPLGFIYFENIPIPYVLSYPSTYTKVAPVTVAPGVSLHVTEGTNARLTYVGAGEVMDCTCNISLDQASGSNRDIEFAIYRNGSIVPGSKGIITTSTGNKHFLTVSAAMTMATNDYLEVFVKNNGASGDVNIYTFSLYIDPH